jgi:phosphonate transport system ATP-binding protein
VAVVELEQVSVRYGPVVALEGIDLRIGAGERVALLGPSGAGKSTLLAVLGGRVRPDEGRAIVLGHHTDALRGRAGRSVRRRIGTVHQDFALTDSLRVVHNVNAGRLGSWSTARALRSLVSPVDRDRVRGALERVGIADRIDARAADLSGGQRQRVAIARLLVQDPDLVLADEPAASLDPELGRLAVTLLSEVAATPERALVVSLHDPALAVGYCDRVVGLRTGGIRFDSPAGGVTEADLAELYRR